MKKLISALLALTMMLSVTACGGSGNNSGNSNNSSNANSVTDNSTADNSGDSTEDVEAPDLRKYYDDFMASLGEDNTPAMSPVEGEALDGLYEGLSAIETKQLIAEMAMISIVAYEFVLVEVANADDVETVEDILQARIDSQVNGGGYYPDTIAAWEKAEVIVNGNVVALILAGEQQDDAVNAFHALFA